jgi:hypothetical protein
MAGLIATVRVAVHMVQRAPSPVVVINFSR